MKQNYTKSANNALRYAKKIAFQLTQEYVGSEHLLLGLMKEKSGIAYAVLEKNGVEEGFCTALGVVIGGFTEGLAVGGCGFAA